MLLAKVNVVQRILLARTAPGFTHDVGRSLFPTDLAGGFTHDVGRKLM